MAKTKPGNPAGHSAYFPEPRTQSESILHHRKHYRTAYVETAGDKVEAGTAQANRGYSEKGGPWRRISLSATQTAERRRDAAGRRGTGLLHWPQSAGL